MHQCDPQPAINREHVFALVDGNSFYCSCERVFHPSLIGQPVIVLSNNDGCAISRTDEAKALGIKMGDPLHLIKHIVARHRVRVFSSNYALYGDMSARMMHTLAQFTPHMQVYSIDEAFVSLDGFARDGLTEYARTIRAVVRRDTGIPTCVGIAPTKVLAKVANRVAKRRTGSGGVLNMCDAATQDEILDSLPVEDVWGIGARSAATLGTHGVRTAKQLRDHDLDHTQRLLTIVGRRIAMELRGQSCLPLQMIQEARKQIISSKSFGRPVRELDEMLEAVANYVTRAAEKLRGQHSLCHHVTVFVQTNRFQNVPQYYNSGAATLATGTASTVRIIQAAHQVLRGIFRAGFKYTKAGVMLADIRPASTPQFSLFDDQQAHARDATLARTVDAINTRMGRDTLKVATCGTTQAWGMNAKMRTPCYTTRWQDLLRV